MRVTGNDHVNSRCWRINLQFLKVVQDVEPPHAELHHLSVWILLGPAAGIDISSDRSDRRNLTELNENVRTTDITGMDDMARPSESPLCLWP
jgi:hypothetical protein